MPQLMMHSPVTEAVNPGTFTQFHAMPPRCITAPEELTSATGLTIQSCCIAGPNGGKFSAVGPDRRRFKRPRSEDPRQQAKCPPRVGLCRYGEIGGQGEGREKMWTTNRSQRAAPAGRFWLSPDHRR